MANYIHFLWSIPGYLQRASVNNPMRHEWSETDSTTSEGKYLNHPALFVVLINPQYLANLVISKCFIIYISIIWKKNIVQIEVLMEKNVILCMRICWLSWSLIKSLKGYTHAVHFNATNRFFFAVIKSAYWLISRNRIMLILVIVFTMTSYIFLFCMLNFCFSKSSDFRFHLSNCYELLSGNLINLKIRVMGLPFKFHIVNVLHTEFNHLKDFCSFDGWKNM